VTGRLPACTARDVDRALKRGGFVVVHQKGSHRYYANALTGKVASLISAPSRDRVSPRFPLGRKFVAPPASRRIQHIDRRRIF
jgi:predicted RNA binding protein YcfA (HicA-like mRNA interferase family)